MWQAKFFTLSQRKQNLCCTIIPKTNKQTKGHKDSRNKRRKETIEETDETLEITPLSSGKAGEALCATHKRNTGSQQASDFLINWQKDEHLPTPWSGQLAETCELGSGASIETILFWRDGITPGFGTRSHGQLSTVKFVLVAELERDQERYNPRY